MIEVTEKELAECLGLSDRRIRQLYKEGIAVKSQKGRYDLQKSVLSYINTLRAKEKAKEENLEKLKIAKEAEQLSHERLRKRKTELVVRQLEKKLHTSEDVEFYWNSMAMSIKSRLLTIPIKCAPLLVGIEDKKEIQGILKQEVQEALNELANYDVDKFEMELEEEQQNDGTGKE